MVIKMKRKIMLILIALVTLCIAVGAVSAWEVSFGSQSSSSSSVSTDGGVANIDYKDGALKINDKEFKIPNGYTQDTNLTATGENANMSSDSNAKLARAVFNNGDKQIIVKCIYTNGEITQYTPDMSNAQNKTINGHAGSLETYNDGKVRFSYVDGGKIFQIESPDEATLSEILK